MMENMPWAVRLMISATFKSFKEGPFLTKTVGELMWGYDSGLVDFLNKYLPGMLPSSGKFGLFADVSAFFCPSWFMSSSSPRNGRRPEQYVNAALSV